jgi:CelD/BcsL family acetyltransferase involved in cellulose biosynthesis
MKTLLFELFSDEEVFEQIDDQAFRKQWLDLHEQCEYATIFQHPSYIITWYKTYRRVCHPILITSKNEGNQLKGLWFLNFDKATQKIEHAGTNQAEYQVWITTKGHESEFISGSWDLLISRLDFKELHLKYLPENYLLDYLRTGTSTRGKFVSRSYERPFFCLNEKTIQDMFSANTRRRVSKFEKIGKVEFVRIKTIEEFDSIFERLVDFYDFRMGALKQVIPFRSDKFKKEFHRNLFLSDTENIICTATYVNGQPVASQFSGLSKKTYCFLLLMHEPFLTKKSPGYMHLLQLSRYAKQEDIRKIDLTPGGDSWKERFATDSDQVIYAVLYRSKFSKIRAELKQNLKDTAKTILSKLGINGGAIKLKTIALGKHLKAILSAMPKQKVSKLELFECSAQQLQFQCQDANAFSILENSINDLLFYNPDETTSARCEFLLKTYQFIEAGATSYSVSASNCLLANIWTAKNGQVLTIDDNEFTGLPPENTALFGLYFNEKVLTENDAKSILNAILDKNTSENETVYFAVESGNRFAVDVIKSLGFNKKTS